MADYQWPQADNRSLIGKRISRLDGPIKSSGRATYTYDVQRPGLLFGKMVLSPHAHARILSIDTSSAERMPGVQAVDIIRDAGQEVLWAGQEILAVAAETDEQARDAARAVKITYEKLPHLVSDVEPAQAGDRAEVLAEQVTGDPDAGFREADATIEGRYGSPVITHCCLESHGQVTEWEGENLTAWASTQVVTNLASQFAQGLEVPAANVRTITPMMGGGFGSKFQADTWGLSCARLAKQAGRPVKMMLERDQELRVAGHRPSAFAKVKVGVKNDGTITAWDSDCWGSGGMQRWRMPPLPYVFT
ncbi:MAG: xanthine dehydrogenase family protein molybdopterin-binding subunit, partial [Candidatus Acidiferrales bacterium]